MDPLTQAQQEFLRGIELLTRAFNTVLRVKRPAATGFYPTFSPPMPKGPAAAPMATEEQAI